MYHFEGLLDGIRLFSWILGWHRLARAGFELSQTKQKKNRSFFFFFFLLFLIRVSKQKKQDFSSKFSYPYQLFYLEDWVFQHDFAKESICTHFKTKNLKTFESYFKLLENFSICFGILEKLI